MQMSHIYLCQGGYVFIGVCLFVCLSVSRIMQKLLDWISQNAVEKWQDIGRNGYISVVIQICQQLQFSAKYFEFPRSQQFLPRDAMRMLSLCCGPVSVHLSVTFYVMHSIQLAEDKVRLLRHPGSPIILVPRRTPSLRGAKYKGVGKFCNFRQKSPSISEMVRDRPMVAMEH